MMPTEPPPSTTNGGKEKRTRRRLRVSCVECTKRRQKCDRQTPCGLCVSRGVSHLCKWESHPVARPTPARPPANATPVDACSPDSAGAASSANSNAGSGQTAAELAARIATLERTIVAQNDLIQRAGIDAATLDHTRASSVDTIDSADELDVDRVAAIAEPIGHEVQEAAMALAQLSLGNHHGEYFGRGTVVCTLRHLRNPKEVALPYSMSTNPTSLDQPVVAHPFSTTFAASMRALVLGIPPEPRTRALLHAFFEDVNWRFGIPQEWFHHACDEMWRTLARSDTTGMEINVHWLCLFYAVLALAPQNPHPGPHPSQSQHPHQDESEAHFMRSLAARRLAKDVYFAAPTFSPLHSAADGTVLGCLATPLLCAYLAEMGRVSEAWKLLGGSIRAAQAVGMHRDPGWEMWRAMPADEQVLRTTGWWGLIVWDRLYSFVLGRPTMIRKENFDVLAPSAFEPHFPAWRQVYCAYQAELVKLSDVVGEAMERCLGITHATFETVFEVDRKFAAWENELPEQFRWRQWYQLNLALGHLLTANSHPIADIRRCYLLNTWYLACRMNLHRSYLTQLTAPGPAPAQTRKVNLAALKQSHEECVSLAIDLLRLQCITHDSAYRNASRRENAAWTGNNWAFELCYYLFDAGVTLMSAFSRLPVAARAKEAQELVGRSVVILESMSGEYRSGGGAAKREIALRAVDVLNMLGRELGWRREGEPVAGGAGDGAGRGEYPPAPVQTQTRIPAQPHPLQHPLSRTHSRTSHSQPHPHPHPQPQPQPQMHAHPQQQQQPQPQQQQQQQQHPGWQTLPEMHSYGFVPQPPLPVPLDASNSTPLSRFFSAPHNSSLISSFGQPPAEMGHPPLMWADLQSGAGAGEYW